MILELSIHPLEPLQSFLMAWVIDSHMLGPTPPSTIGGKWGFMRSQNYTWYIYIYVYVLKSFYLFWRGSFDSLLFGGENFQTFHFSLEMASISVSWVVFFCWYQVEVRRRMEKQTFGDHSDGWEGLWWSFKNLKGCNVLQSNEAPIGVVGMVQKVCFSRVQVVAIFQKGKREGSAFFSWV